MTTVYENKGKWYCRPQINGVRLHRLCRGCLNREQAIIYEAELIVKTEKQQNGIIPKDEKRQAFNKLCDIFVKYSEQNKKSYKADKGRIKIIRTFFKNKKYIDEIKPNDIENLKAYLLSIKRKEVTVNRYLEIISKMYNIAIYNEWIEKNPIKKDMRFPEKNYKVRYLRNDEEERLFNASSESFKPILMVALNTGLRRDNIRTLKWSNINFEFRLIELTKNKGNKHIKLYMNDTLYNLFLKLPRVNDEYVFINPRTKRVYSESSFYREWCGIRERSKLDGFRFHDLRHTVGTRLAQANIAIPVIREVLAHSEIKTTMRYVHTASEQMQSAMNILNSF